MDMSTGMGCIDGVQRICIAGALWYLPVLGDW